ncbi:MAG: hypothetical protein IKX40_05235 [Thermoguttaceae bacterium]|nr:hypothetical protein [Thermoguttaceae bacterium]
MNNRFLSRTFFAIALSAIIAFVLNSMSYSQDAAPEPETAAVETPTPVPESETAPAEPETAPAQPEETPAQSEASENSEPLPEVADLSETEEEKKVATPEIENAPTAPVVQKAEDLDPEANAEPTKPVDSLNQLWKAMGVSESQWELFKDGEAWNPAQNNFTAQLIYTAKRFPLDFILPWTQTPQAAADMLDGKDVQDEEKKDIAFELRAFNRTEQRGALYHLEGTAEAIESVSLISELQTRFEMDSLYFVAVKLNSGHRVLIITSVIPKKWKTGASVSYPVSADAYFLKYGPLDKQTDKPRHSYFIATRIAWHPDTPLGNLGMDYGLFDELDTKPLQGRKIPYPTDCTLNERNRECFYQELAAVKRALDPKTFAEIKKLALTQRDEVWNMRDPRNTMTVERQSYPVEALFNDPIAQRGNLFWLTGRARRIVAIPVDAPDVRARFGIEQYYNIYLFTSDSDDNPLVINVLELPEGVQTGDGAGFGVDLSVPCFMFNTWMYRRADEAKGHAYQLAPLLFAPKALKYETQQSERSNVISNGILLLMALIIVYFFVRTLFSKPAQLVQKEENFQYKPHDPNAVEPGFDYQFPEKKPNYKKIKKRK